MNTTRVSRRSVQAALLALTINLILVASATAKTAKSTQFANIRIKNFGQMDERFYRGAQPKPEDYKDLAALGINTIVDLRDNPESYSKTAAEAAGLRYVNIPLSDSQAPTQEHIDQFLQLVNNPETGHFFVHCAGGRHRTGMMGAVYRMNHDGWNFDQAYKEMKDYDFYTRWGHQAIKDYVEGYYSNLQTVHVSTGEASANK
jgi:protein tyrosine/serine phosphatase